MFPSVDLHNEAAAAAHKAGLNCIGEFNFIGPDRFSHNKKIELAFQFEPHASTFGPAAYNYCGGLWTPVETQRIDVISHRVEFPVSTPGFYAILTRGTRKPSESCRLHPSPREAEVCALVKEAISSHLNALFEVLSPIRLEDSPATSKKLDEIIHGIPLDVIALFDRYGDVVWSAKSEYRRKQLDNLVVPGKASFRACEIAATSKRPYAMTIAPQVIEVGVPLFRDFPHGFIGVLHSTDDYSGLTGG